MPIRRAEVQNFYGEIEAVSSRYGLTVADAVLVLAMENSARDKRSGLKLIDSDQAGKSE